LRSVFSLALVLGLISTPARASESSAEQGPPPAPVATSDEVEAPLRNLQLGAYAGISQRTSETESIDYAPAFSWGFNAEIEPLSWLAVVASLRLEKIATTIKAGGLDTGDDRYPNTSFEQPALDVLGLGAGLKPQWVILEHFKLYALLNLEWSRFIAKAPKSAGEKSIRSAERTGVGVNYQAGVGASAEPIKDWLNVSLSFRVGSFGQQSGTAFETLQGIDETGNIVHLGPLPRFELSFDVLLGVSLVL
jgi:hypothetical protein